MAEYLETSLRAVPEVKQLFPRETNAVFCEMPRPIIEDLWKRGWRFYTFIGAGGCRLMCSWDTKHDDVDAFVGDAKELSPDAPE